MKYRKRPVVNEAVSDKGIIYQTVLMCALVFLIGVVLFADFYPECERLRGAVGILAGISVPRTYRAWRKAWMTN
jgi:hypothetical protein